MTTKTSRTADTREKTQRKRVWQRPSSLDAPPAPDGYIHRWIRAEVQGYQDTKNVISRLREGYELAKLKTVQSKRRVKRSKHQTLLHNHLLLHLIHVLKNGQVITHGLETTKP